jgi:hypothetical protein
VAVGSDPDYRFVGWVGVIHVQRIVRVLELAGAVMEELGNAQGPRTDAVVTHCREFMLAMKVTGLPVFHFPQPSWPQIAKLLVLAPGSLPLLASILAKAKLV